ncbi:hypothetical protein LLG95_13715 [bacterium]|nr:hypothetical protein [bacterium]
MIEDSDIRGLNLKQVLAQINGFTRKLVRQLAGGNRQPLDFPGDLQDVVFQRVFMFIFTGLGVAGVFAGEDHLRRRGEHKQDRREDGEDVGHAEAFHDRLLKTSSRKTRNDPRKSPKSSWLKMMHNQIRLLIHFRVFRARFRVFRELRFAFTIL